tara:strand:+ start:467 stop:670 length:204 start_codon:yes stop_codon:yes gene_type:complete
MKGEIEMGVVNEAIENFKRIDIDGETMQYIIEKLGMDNQILRQLVMIKPKSQTEELLNEKIEMLRYV